MLQGSAWTPRNGGINRAQIFSPSGLYFYVRCFVCTVLLLSLLIHSVVPNSHRDSLTVFIQLQLQLELQLQTTPWSVASCALFSIFFFLSWFIQNLYRSGHPNLMFSTRFLPFKNFQQACRYTAWHSQISSRLLFMQNRTDRFGSPASGSGITENSKYKIEGRSLLFWFQSIV